MPDFQFVKAPVFPPTLCFACNTHSHPDGFIDLLSEDPTGRRHYLCAGCVHTASQRMGCLSPQQADELTRRVTDAHAAIDALERELAAERDNKVVSIADVKAMLRAGVQTKPRTTA